MKRSTRYRVFYEAVKPDTHTARGYVASRRPVRRGAHMRLECRQIDFYYPGTDKKVLDNLSIDLSEPGFHAFFGPSGVGKTSLARIISGGMRAASGEVRTNTAMVVLYTYNLERLPGWSSIGRHIERITPTGKKDLRDALVNAFDMAPLLHQRFDQLSLGQQNRINLIRYLLQEFDLLLMDESLANVDELTRGRILSSIKEMFPRKIFVYISHNVGEVATFCRWIWVLRGGHRSPQAVAVQGQDHSGPEDPDQKRLQTTMLEIMNAA